MSVYRQQAIVPPSSNAACMTKTNRTETFHQKSNAVASYPSSNKQAVVNIKYSSSIGRTPASLEVSEKQAEFISKTMRDLRQKELEARASKRIKIDHMFRTASQDNENQHVSCSNNGLDIVDEMELHSSIAQVVATSGGLITVCKC
jgi:hypothetical protein